MVTRSPMVAKAMTPINIRALMQTPNNCGCPQFNATLGATTKTPNKPSPGSNPSASMFNGPYGGKKPV